VIFSEIFLCIAHTIEELTCYGLFYHLVPSVVISPFTPGDNNGDGEYFDKETMEKMDSFRLCLVRLFL
jgi:hypothetical protein